VLFRDYYTEQLDQRVNSIFIILLPRKACRYTKRVLMAFGAFTSSAQSFGENRILFLKLTVTVLRFTSELN